LSNSEKKETNKRTDSSAACTPILFQLLSAEGSGAHELHESGLNIQFNVI